MRARPLLFVLLVVASLVPARAETLTVFGAGSLTVAFKDLLARFPAGSDTILTPEFGPSGLMRERIEGGAPADLFASADMEQARRLAAGRPERSVILFTRNRLCAIAHDRLGLTPATLLDTMLDPKVRLATSVPGADPLGDYSWAVFSRADAVRPGAKAALEAKALPLFGGGDRTPLLVPGEGGVEGVFLADKGDLVLSYCSAAPATVRRVTGLTSVPLPPELTVGPAYGLVLLGGKTVALRFAAFVMSEQGQAALKSFGFDPVGSAEPRPEDTTLYLRRGTAAPVPLTRERAAAMPALTQKVTFSTSHGPETAEWTGPTLFDALAGAGLLDPAKPAEQVRMTVRVTGSDGYVASFSAGELSPQFAGRPIQLATAMDGKPLGAGHWRLVVPGEVRAGRSVRDVVRIEVE